MGRRKLNRERAERNFARRSRNRTSSQSSVEIQVSEHETIVSTTTNSTNVSVSTSLAPVPTQTLMVAPSPPFTHLLKTVGANGQISQRGELFTIKEVLYYLKEYIKTRHLFDELNPLHVNCDKDPLQQVFGVNHFRVNDALHLVKNNVTYINPVELRSRSPVERSGMRTPPPTLPQISIMDALRSQGYCTSENSPQPGEASPAPRADAPEADPSVSSTTITPKLNEELRRREEEVTDDEIIPPTQVPATRTGGGPQALFMPDEIPPSQPSTSKAQPSLHNGNPTRGRFYNSPSNSQKITASSETSDDPNNPETSTAEADMSQACQAEKLVLPDSPVPGTSRSCDQELKSNLKKSAKRKRKRNNHSISYSSGVDEADGDLPPRKRGSSLSITCQGDGDDDQGTPWLLTVEWQEELDFESDETVLSIQSKVTAVVEDSEDDLWFIGDKDGDFSLQMDDDELSIEFPVVSNHGNSHGYHYEEEYEPQSDFSFRGNEETDEDESDSPIEEIVVVCTDGDMDFWADSESSDAETDEFDEDIEQDKWECEKCSKKTPPTRGRCDYCRALRPGWIKDKIKTTNDSSSSAPTTCASVDTSQPSTSLSLGQSQTLIPKLAQQDTVRLSHMQQQQPVSAALGAPPSSPRRPPPLTLNSSSFITDRPPPSPRRRPHSRDAMSPRKRLSSVEYVTRGTADNDKMYFPKSPLPVDVAFPFGQKLMNRSRSVLSPLRPSPKRHRSQSCSDSPFRSPRMSPRSPAVMWAMRGRPGLPTLGSTAIKNLTFDDSGGKSDVRAHRCRLASDSACGISQESGTSQATELFDGDDVFEDTSRVMSRADTCDSGIMLGSSDTSFATSHSSSFNKAAENSQNLSSQDSAIDMGKISRVSFADNRSGASIESPVPVPTSPRKKARLSLPHVPTLQRLTEYRPVPGSPRKRTASGTEYNDLCVICLSRPKEASIIHGKTGHQVCCYVCAKRLRRRGKPCPVCRRPIQRVIKNYVV